MLRSTLDWTLSISRHLPVKTSLHSQRVSIQLHVSSKMYAQPHTKSSWSKASRQSRITSSAPLISSPKALTRTQEQCNSNQLQTPRTLSIYHMVVNRLVAPTQERPIRLPSIKTWPLLTKIHRSQACKRSWTICSTRAPLTRTMPHLASLVLIAWIRWTMTTLSRTWSTKTQMTRHVSDKAQASRWETT